MSKYNVKVLLAALLTALCAMSCSESDDTENEFDDWKNRNEAFFADVYATAKDNKSGDWRIIRNYTLEDSLAANYYDDVVVKVLHEGEGSGSPLYTDSVMVSYRGRLMPTTSYPGGYVFDQTYTGEYNPATAKPSKLLVSSLIDGFSTVLQYMRIGDHWRVYVPYQLGYGSSDNSDIPAYSTLVFDIALVAYYRAGTPTDPLLVGKSVWVEE